MNRLEMIFVLVLAGIFLVSAVLGLYMGTKLYQGVDYRANPDQNCSITVNHTEDQSYKTTSVLLAGMVMIPTTNTHTNEHQYFTCLNGSVLDAGWATV
jgi:hypothetical protein